MTRLVSIVFFILQMCERSRSRITELLSIGSGFESRSLQLCRLSTKQLGLPPGIPHLDWGYGSNWSPLEGTLWVICVPSFPRVCHLFSLLVSFFCFCFLIWNNTIQLVKPAGRTILLLFLNIMWKSCWPRALRQEQTVRGLLRGD